MELCETPLDSLLDQTIDKCNLRSILAAHGIPSNEIVRIEISTENRVIASCNVPVRVNEVPDKISLYPLTELRDNLKNFFNDGQRKFNLVEHIEDYTTPSSLFKVTLFIGIKRAQKTKITNIELSFFYLPESPCTFPPDLDCCST